MLDPPFTHIGINSHNALFWAPATEHAQEPHTQHEEHNTTHNMTQQNMDQEQTSMCAADAEPTHHMPHAAQHGGTPENNAHIQNQWHTT
eukprot:3702084-Prorocentrum_lima.AAC.1